MRFCRMKVGVVRVSKVQRVERNMIAVRIQVSRQIRPEQILLKDLTLLSLVDSLVVLTLEDLTLVEVVVILSSTLVKNVSLWCLLKRSPTEGLEPSTTRLRAWRSTD